MDEHPPRSVFLATSSLPWRASPHPGVEWKKLHHDGETGRSAVLLRFAAGASYGAHRHPAGEEYLILEGGLIDGGQEQGPGSYVLHPPGSVHQPQATAAGCVVFVRLPQPIEEL